MTDRQYCSRTGEHEPMAGTAASVDVWLLMEYRPVWNARVQAENNLTETTRCWLENALAVLAGAGYQPRLQFIRQPEIDRADTRLLIAAQDNLVELGGSGYTFLDDVDVLDVVGDPTAYPRLKKPRYFVCTNGQRDLCCARFGLPTYRTLREEVGDRVWQATHLGGHRFAPNVLALPDGVLYGRVNVDDVADFLAATESGEVAFRHLRGRSRYSAPVQAAEAALGRPGLELQHVDNGNPEVTVTFSAGDELLKIAVRQGKDPLSVVKSCGDEAEPVYPYYAV